MINPDPSRVRTSEDYKDLSRSVAVNHFKTESTKKKEHVFSNVLQNFFKNKWVLWVIHYIKSRFGPKHPFLTYQHQTDKGIYTLQARQHTNKIKIALAGDWATDTIESKHISSEIRKHQPDYTIHLGDTYFVGAPFEIGNNFAPPDPPWHYGAVGSFALTGNHEMYSNGNGYFDKLLPWMGLYYPERITQKANYFCLQNDYWRIVGLDTGYRSVGIPILELLFSKANLRKEVIGWLKNELQLENDNRGLILLSHHQYTSSFDKTYAATAKQLAKIISNKREVIWFWGHEHRFAVYGKYAASGGIAAYGRCIGHGGMPVSIVKEDEEKKRTKESNLILYDNRICKQIEGTNIGHNGYALLTIENENLQVQYYDEQHLLFAENWQYNKELQQIESKSTKILCSKLTVMQEIFGNEL